MKQISIDTVYQFLRENHIKLKSTHCTLCYPIIERIYKKMSIGIRFSNIKVDKDVIIDGHHRYVASLLANTELDKDPSYMTSATVVSNWETVDLDEEDWDTEAKIVMLNEQDAEFNNIELNKLIEILN